MSETKRLTSFSLMLPTAEGGNPILFVNRERDAVPARPLHLIDCVRGGGLGFGFRKDRH
jgi:hypothetical protein